MIDSIPSYFLVFLPVLFNLMGMMGFNIIDSILGGQTLASVPNGNMSWTYVLLIGIFLIPSQRFLHRVGIVIVAAVSLVISFMGYTVLHWYSFLRLVIHPTR